MTTGRKLFGPIYTLPAWNVTTRKLDQVQTWLAQAVHRDAGKELLIRGPDESAQYRIFLYSLGRSLWGGKIAAVLELSNDLDKAATASLRLAASKTHENPSKERALALLSYRLQFHIYDLDLTETLIARWMRFPIRVTPDRRYIQTAQPREPVLAAVAKAEMEDPGTLARIIEHFTAYYHGGPVNAEDAGEMVASILLLLAADSVKSGPAGPAVPLRTFIKALLGEHGPASDDLQGQVHLTHICRFHGKDAITHSHLIHAFLSGLGWLLSTTAEGADLLLPVWNPDTGRVGGLLVQVKNRSKYARITPGLWQEAIMHLESAQKESSNSFDGAPLYGLFMELRSNGNAADFATERLAGTRFPSIVAFGLAGSVYPVLAGNDRIRRALYGMLNRVIAGDDSEDSGLMELLATRDGTSLLT